MNTQSGSQPSTSTPSTPSFSVGGRAKANSKRGRKSRGASVAPSPDPQQASVQWAMPLQSNTDKAGTSSAVTGDHSGINGLAGGSEPTAAGLTRAGTLTVPGPSAGTAVDDEGEGDEDLLPDMADDDYSAQLSWQSQSKDNLK